MARTVTARGVAGVDTSDFKKLIRALRKADSELAVTVRKGLRASGEIVAERARDIASEHSTSIPPTIKVRTAGAAVAVVAGGGDVAIAELFELGNARGAKSVMAGAATFRHPVFGNGDRWVTQATHPFLAPALEESLPEVETAVTEALDVAVKSLTII